MLFSIRCSTGFDGTTVLPDDAQFIQSDDNNVYHIADNAGVSLVTLGRIPLERLVDFVGSSMMRVALFYHSGDGVTEARAGAGYHSGGITHRLTRTRVWDPSLNRNVEGLPMLNRDWSLTLESNANGAQAMMFEVLPIDSDTALAAAVQADQFGGVEAPAQLVAGSFTSVKTAAYTAGAGQVVLYDTSGGAFTVTLPSSPTTNDVIGFVDAGNSAAAALTIDGDGNNVQSSSAGTFAATQTYQIASGNIYYRFDGTQWRIVSVRD